jgi:hypothetical protein
VAATHCSLAPMAPAGADLKTDNSEHLTCADVVGDEDLGTHTA